MFVVVVVVVGNTSFIPWGKFGSHYMGKVTAAARAALPSPISVCRFLFVCLFVVVVVVVVVVANTSFIHWGKFGSHYMGKVTAAARAALPSPISMCSISVCPTNGTAASVLGIVTCGQMFIHATVHGGCTDTITESAMNVDWEKKNCRTGESNQCQYCPWRFGPTLHQLNDLDV